MIKKIGMSSGSYPANLKNIYDPPKQLYVNGNILEEDRNAVAIVGSRRASIYGLEMGEKLGYDLAARGITVVSGMAIGIDTAAHRGALKAKGRTIAVLGSGHNNIYPSQNRELYQEIARTGAVVTEYEDDMEPLRYNFPRRNRIISGLSLGVVIVEAARNSGALITADFAAEQGREVFAVPGKISSNTSSGTNELIKDGARLIQSVDDIFEELSIKGTPSASGVRDEAARKAIASKTKTYIYNSLTDNERKIYKLLSDEPIYIDEILTKTGLDSSIALKTILGMQLKSLIKEIPGKQFIRKGE